MYFRDSVYVHIANSIEVHQSAVIGNILFNKDGDTWLTSAKERQRN